MNVPRHDIPLPEIDQAPEVITSIETGDISIAEIKRAIHRLKNGKSPGIDAISAEMLKCSENDAVKQLHLLFNSIWKAQCVPEDWKKSLTAITTGNPVNHAILARQRLSVVPDVILMESPTCQQRVHSRFFFFYKNVVFTAQAEYSYFSADFRMKIFLYYP